MHSLGRVSLPAEPLPVGETRGSQVDGRPPGRGITRPARSPVARKVGETRAAADIGRAPSCARGAEPHRTKEKMPNRLAWLPNIDHLESIARNGGM